MKLVFNLKDVLLESASPVKKSRFDLKIFINNFTYYGSVINPEENHQILSEISSVVQPMESLNSVLKQGARMY